MACISPSIVQEYSVIYEIVSIFTPLSESTKSILCGGAIIEGNLVATAAHCVEG